CLTTNRGRRGRAAHALFAVLREGAGLCRPPRAVAVSAPRPPQCRRAPGRAAFGRVVGRPGRWLGTVVVSGRLAGRRGSVRGRRSVRHSRRGESVVGAGMADSFGRWRDVTGVDPGGFRAHRVLLLKVLIEEFVHFSVMNWRYDIVAASLDYKHFHFHGSFFE